ncbi:MAG: translation elongation factor Ts [Spirochaetes bacterium]|nr:translation elongation factor Ts [Spirochaetota bacterium]MBU0956140.1 translation elongation factor Ts [Spirochaetota bacterium]
MEIKASDIKLLRDKTGAGMMDCKKALVEGGGDPVKAEKLIKEWGLAGVEKRSGRATNEGRIFLAEKDGSIVAIELGCETDFVARNEDFIKFGNNTAALCLEKGWTASNEELETMVRDVASVIKENITLKRVVAVKAAAGELLHSYMHGEGRIGVIVKAAADKAEALQNAEVQGFVHDIALHIAAYNPVYLDQSKVDATWVKEQQEIFTKQMEGDEKMKGKPANVIEGILKGKINKAMSEICLMDQGFVKDEKQKVSAVIQGLQKATGSNFTVVDYNYIRVGE